MILYDFNLYSHAYTMSREVSRIVQPLSICIAKHTIKIMDDPPKSTHDKWLCVNQFGTDNFHCSVTDIVHLLDPQHLIFSLRSTSLMLAT